MKVKIINNCLEDYGNEFKVRRMNYDQIIVNYPTGMGLKKFTYEDVECISENEIDDFLINNRMYLKIKLKRGISVTFYNALNEALKLEIGEEVKNLNILKDKYNINKRGIWEKHILLVANDKFPLEVYASGQNFKRDNYNINISEVERTNFLEECNEEINRINREIEERNHMIQGFFDAIEKISSIDEPSNNAG